MVEIDKNLKPRTIPDALGLSERKYKAIYDTVEESVKEMATIDALVSLKETFPESKDELIAAIYMFSVKIGYAKAKGKIEAEGQMAFVAGQVVALAQAEAYMQELEARGIIKVINREALRNPNNAPKPRENNSGVPDDLLYGAPKSGETEREPCGTCHTESNDEPAEKPEKPKANDDPMYG